MAKKMRMSFGCLAKAQEKTRHHVPYTRPELMVMESNIRKCSIGELRRLLEKVATQLARMQEHTPEIRNYVSFYTEDGIMSGEVSRLNMRGARLRSVTVFPDNGGEPIIVDVDDILGLPSRMRPATAPAPNVSRVDITATIKRPKSAG